MKNNLIPLFLAISLLCACSYSKDLLQKYPHAKLMEMNSGDKHFNVQEEAAHFPGGNQALIKYIDDNLQWPKDLEDGPDVQGRVVIEFDVEKNGKLTNIKVGRPLHPSCDREAIRLVKAMPRWKPAKLMGIVHKCRASVIVTFKLM